MDREICRIRSVLDKKKTPFVFTEDESSKPKDIQRQFLFEKYFYNLTLACSYV